MRWTGIQLDLKNTSETLTSQARGRQQIGYVTLNGKLAVKVATHSPLAASSE